MRIQYYQKMKEKQSTKLIQKTRIWIIGYWGGVIIWFIFRLTFTKNWREPVLKIKISNENLYLWAISNEMGILDYLMYCRFYLGFSFRMTSLISYNGSNLHSGKKKKKSFKKYFNLNAFLFLCISTRHPNPDKVNKMPVCIYTTCYQKDVTKRLIFKWSTAGFNSVFSFS